MTQTETVFSVYGDGLWPMTTFLGSSVEKALLDTDSSLLERS